MNEFIGIAAAICTTGAFVPQAWKTIKSKDTSSISLEMYLIFTLGVLLWLVYGILIDDFPIIAANTVTFALAFTILCFKLKYK